MSETNWGIGRCNFTSSSGVSLIHLYVSGETEIREEYFDFTNLWILSKGTKVLSYRYRIDGTESQNQRCRINWNDLQTSNVFFTTKLGHLKREFGQTPFYVVHLILSLSLSISVSLSLYLILDFYFSHYIRDKYVFNRIFYTRRDSNSTHDI